MTVAPGWQQQTPKKKPSGLVLYTKPKKGKNPKVKPGKKPKS